MCCVLAVAFIGVFAVGAEAFFGLFGSTPAMSDEDFVRLIRSGSAQEVRAAIQGGANVNARVMPVFSYVTPLTEAVRYNSYVEVVTALLEGGADIEATITIATSSNNTALHIAARRRYHPEFVAALIDGGANIEALREESQSLGGGGQTPLMDAARSGNLGAVTRLLAAGANVDAVSSEGYTALMLAARRWPETVIALINGGADVNITRQVRMHTFPGSNEPQTRPQTALDIAQAMFNNHLRDTEALRMLQELTQN